MILNSKVPRKLYKIGLFYKVNRYSTIKNIKDVDIEKIKNMGILAHIDAGRICDYMNKNIFY